MKKTPTLLQSFLPIVVLTSLLIINVFAFEDALGGATQVSLIFAGLVASLIAIINGHKWAKIKETFLNTISNSMSSIIILLLIGSISGTWMISGVVPFMIYYGLDVLHPSVFLFAAVVISAIVSMFTGSSWSTIATVGIALLGIGKTMGIDQNVIAGAIISGAYFGDKMSPLSDTTNLAPAMVGTDLFTHIRYMMYTTVPSLILTLIIFIIWGFTLDFDSNIENVSVVQQAIAANFSLNPLLLLVPIILIVIIAKKVPPIPAMFVGVMLGALSAVIFQPQIVETIANDSTNYLKASYVTVMQAIFGHVSVSTGTPSIDRLFSTGGMGGMLNTVWLIITAMIFGGAMEAGGFLARITQALLKYVKTSTSLVATTAASCIFFNMTTCDHYLAIVISGRMYKDAFDDLDLAPEVLSRTLEDAGTVTSPLVPWSTCGATQARVLGVATLDYLPYCFFNLLSPVMSVVVMAVRFKIRNRKGEPRILGDINVRVK
ncbi:MAG: Na+/H+ antiporter NhaC [Marinifilaceae bacterium]